MLLRWHKQVQQLNQAVPVQYYSATRRGRPVQIPWQPKEISANVKATGERLIKDYVTYCEGLFIRAGKAAFLDPAGNPQLPPLFTNSVRIGERRSLSDRQARDHVRKLQQVGLVSYYKWHGSRSDYEIRINEQVLFGPKQAEFWELVGIAPLPVDSAGSQMEIPQFAESSTELSSAYQVTVTYRDKETETYKRGNVHSDRQNRNLMSEHSDNDSDTERPQQGQLPESQARPADSAGNGDKGPGGARAVENAVDNPNGAGARLKAKLTGTRRPRPSMSDQKRREMREGYVRSFWAYAGQVLYTARRWSAQEERLILRSILYGVYGNFQSPLTEKEWDSFQDKLFKRVDLVAAYYQRHPEKWIPEPYAQIKNGTGYFDWENLRGFRATAEWIDENYRHYRQSYVSQRVSLAIRNLRRHRVGRAPKQLQLKTYIEAYRFLESQMTRYGEGALRRFHELAAGIGVDLRLNQPM